MTNHWAFILCFIRGIHLACKSQVGEMQHTCVRGGGVSREGTEGEGTLLWEFSFKMLLSSALLSFENHDFRFA